MLNGAGGDDKLHGREGNDTVLGSGGADRFNCAKGWQSETIKDFAADDFLFLRTDLGITNAAGALSKAIEANGHVTFYFGYGDTLLVENTTKNELSDQIPVFLNDKPSSPRRRPLAWQIQPGAIIRPT